MKVKKVERILKWKKKIKVIKNKIFGDLAKRYEKRDGGYTRILKVDERRGDGALISIIELVK